MPGALGSFPASVWIKAMLPDAALETIALIAEYHAIRRDWFQPEIGCQGSAFSQHSGIDADKAFARVARIGVELNHRTGDAEFGTDVREQLCYRQFWIKYVGYIAGFWDLLEQTAAYCGLAGPTSPVSNTNPPLPFTP